MRIVAVADTHTFERDFEEIPDGDVFIHAGDLLRSGEIETLPPVAAWIKSLPHRHKIVIAGNHDWCFVHQREEACALLGPDVTYLEDASCEIQGLKFWGSPWQPAFHDWAFNLPRGETIAKKWALIHEDTHILITHGPPMGFGDKSSTADRLGCADLLERTRAVHPLLHLFGHIHEDGGLFHDAGRAICNCTSWECERAPTVIDIDPETRTVTPVTIPGRGGY
jgi:predicted phosphohydrolase